MSIVAQETGQNRLDQGVRWGRGIVQAVKPPELWSRLSLSHRVGSGKTLPRWRLESMISKHQLPELMIRGQSSEDAVLFPPQIWEEVDGDRLS